jgi:hypothetical protein
MSSLVPVEVVCPRCGAPRLAPREACPCGSLAARHGELLPAERSPLSPTSLEPVRKFLDSYWVAAGALLLVGPIGLPVVWLNRRIAWWLKIVITAALIGLTVVLPLALVIYWCEIAIRPLVDVMAKTAR